ncbi:MAG: DNA primase small subunit domain-containing protein [Dehalococcoidia bacterium]
MPGSVILRAGDREVPITNPEKVFFPERGYTKLDLANYFLAVGEAALTGVHHRPVVLKRFVNGIGEEPFFQKRAPTNRPPWIRTARVTYPSGRAADLVVAEHVADILWMANLGCVDLNPWPVRADDVDHPDELRVDLDPTPEASWDDVRQVALLVGEVLRTLGFESFPKTSGSRGIHINVRIQRKWTFDDVRRAALALGREVERRAPGLATTAWWKEERHGVFIDYNQNARDRTVASAYSVRAVPDARVSCALAWDEVATVDPAAFTIETVPRRLRDLGDPGAGIDAEAFDLAPLLELARQQAAEGQADAPWPPQFRKAPGEPTRVQPSRRRKPTTPSAGTARQDD